MQAFLRPRRFHRAHAVLLDREQERGQIDRVLDLARQDRSAALVLQGEPGIGKTTLLDYAVESGQDFETVRVLGIESEAELGFAALHQLVLPFAAGLGSLPVPQRDALAGALGLRRADSPDRFLLALAALTMLADAATRRPLLCVVDDAQWLDRESAGILSFIARRLSADAIAMLFAVQDLSERTTRLEGIPSVQIGGLPPEEAGQLLAYRRPCAGHTRRRERGRFARSGRPGLAEPPQFRSSAIVWVVGSGTAAQSARVPAGLAAVGADQVLELVPSRSCRMYG